MAQLRSRTALGAIALFAWLALSAGTARADSFGITLTGNAGSPSGWGTFSTDGICTICLNFGGGILSFSTSLGPDTGADAFDLANDVSFLVFHRSNGSLALSGDLNSETSDVLMFTSATNWELLSGVNVYTGRYTISALFEPSALLSLAIMILGLAGWRARTRWKLFRQ